MRINSLSIRNFRGFENLEFLPEEHVLLVGEPRAGRSTIIDALYRTLSPNGSRGTVGHDLDLFECPGNSVGEHSPLDPKASHVAVGLSLRTRGFQRMGSAIPSKPRTRKVDLGTEVVIAFVPAAIRAYLEVASNLPPPGTSEAVMKVWARAGTGEDAKPDDLPRAGARREVIRQMAVKVRDARFRAAALRIYRDRCAFCGLGAGLIEAAHILGVGEGGLDDVTNGMALCPTHHAAFDKGLLLVGDAGVVVVNRGRLLQLGASQAEIAGLKRGLLGKARTPTGRRFRPDPHLLAAHRERWYAHLG